MFDTKTTDYKITDPACPFHTHPHADVVGSLYDAFRKEGLAISTYFSKPDWHCDYYWYKAFGNSPTSNVNYDIKEHPELWEKFVEYTHTQITELCTNYGEIDVLWLDGGWVNPHSKGQDIRLNELIPKLRQIHPHLIVCDRTIGGNLALNIAPQPDGALPKPAVESLKELGRWMNVFGDGIYETHIVAPYFHDHVKYTAKQNVIYAFYLYDDLPVLPHELKLTVHKLIKTIRSMRTKEVIPFTQNENEVTLDLTSFNVNNAFYAEGFILEEM